MLRYLKKGLFPVFCELLPRQYLFTFRAIAASAFLYILLKKWGGLPSLEIPIWLRQRPAGGISGRFIEMAIEPEEVSGDRCRMKRSICSCSWPTRWTSRSNTRTSWPRSSYSRAGHKVFQIRRSYNRAGPRLRHRAGAPRPRRRCRPSGFNVYSEDATLLCYSLSGEGEVVIDGRAAVPEVRLRLGDCADASQYRATPGKVGSAPSCASTGI